ncbi:MAG: RNA polymerase factor sigma-54 [Acidobacteriia bacterium]|nr:RNA polymerase factor sigma-54 [Terriglobia bacterium]
MALLSPRLNLRVTQKQILTPGLVQMVSVLALNRIELKDMINAEMVENPVLEELDGTVPLLDEVAGKEEERERLANVEADPAVAPDAKDPFDEIDFGSFFQDYLDPGYRSPEAETVEKPSFENFLSKASTLTDHLMWQLGAMSVTPGVREAAELIIGNLSEDGYLTASDEELMGAAYPPLTGARPEVAGTGPAPEPETPGDVEALLDGVDGQTENFENADDILGQMPDLREEAALAAAAPEGSVAIAEPVETPGTAEEAMPPAAEVETPAAVQEQAQQHGPRLVPSGGIKPLFTSDDLQEALLLVRQMDPVGVGARDVRECLLAQLQFLQHAHKAHGTIGNGTGEALADAIVIISDHLRAVQNKQLKEIAKAIGRPLEAVQAALDLVKTLDPRPGLRYNKVEARLIEPDVAFIKHGDDYIAVLNDDDVPQLRLNSTYKKLLSREAAEKDVRNYVKERYKSAIQLIKNIEQRKQTILKVCYAILGRQKDFLDRGIDRLKPMMIKEVAEEIGVHPSTVSRAVANKYAHTPQGVFELRYFFSESVNGPEGGNTSLLILKRRVKKLIEEEDPARPLTDEQITRILQSQGIQVTRRTVAKYREDMHIPSTHQRRVKN